MSEAIDFHHLAKGVVSMRILPVAMIPALLLASSICAASECGRDTDCKGDRVCYQGRCVNPETGGFTALMRTGPAFILGPWVEVRLDLVGAQLLAVKYELEAYYQIEYSSTDHDNEYRTYKENIVAFMYSPSISLVLRI